MDALQQLNLAAPITDTYTRIESMIIMHIAEQIAGNPQGLINNSSEWRIQMLARMGKLSKDTAKIIASQCKGVGYEIEAAINSSVQSVLKTHGLTMTDKLSENIRSALTMYDRQAISGKYNQVNTVMQYKAKQTYLNAVNGTVSRFDRLMQKELANKQEYLDVLNKNAMAVTLGERSRTEAIRATIEEMSDKGIPAFIDVSGREWSAEAYVNMDIRNTVKNAANAAQFASIEELGQDVVLVSSHAGARPLCAPYQGKFYSLSGKSGTIRDARGREYTYEPWSSTSYGEPAGLLGINCGHTIRGVSDGMFINREKQYSEKENSEEYDKVVKQRALESDIRKQKTTRNALKAAGDDEGVKEYNRKIKASTAKLERFCDENGLTVRRDRTEVYGYSDPGRKKKREDFVLTTAQDGGIIKSVNDIGDYIPVSLSSINKVPSMDLFGDTHLNLMHKQRSKQLLMELNSRQLPLGTEMSIIYSPELKRIPGCDYIAGAKTGEVDINDISSPYHAFHTHPSDKSFSLPDLRGMASRPNMLSLTAQGNAGSKYVMMRRKNCDNNGYYVYLSKRSKEVFFSSGTTSFTLDYLHDRNKETEVRALIESLSDSDRDGLHKALRRITDECIAEGDKYGFEYKFQTA